MSRKKLLLGLAFIALPFLVGSSCVVWFSSGGTSDSDKETDDSKDQDKTVVVVSSGDLSDPAVAGAGYASGAIAGITDAGGSFDYQAGETVRFTIGDIPLGDAVAGRAVITPADLVATTRDPARAAANLARLLRSLDADPATAVIEIPAAVRDRARRSNPDVSYAIEYLDYADDAAFANAASQLVAVLTADYPFTAVLVDDGAYAGEGGAKTPAR